MTEQQITEMVDDVLYALAQTTGNDDEPTDAELGMIRGMVEARSAKRISRERDALEALAEQLGEDGRL